jgi:flagellar FliJ protein
MKSFDFKLKTVLEVRVNEEVRAGEVHSEAKSFLEEALSQYQAVEEAIESNLTTCKQAFEGQVASGTLSHLQTALRELRRQLEDLEPVVAERQSLVDTRCKELLQARQRREALEKMRDRQQDEFEQDLVRSEQQAIDEMVLLREAGGFGQRL